MIKTAFLLCYLVSFACLVYWGAWKRTGAASLLFRVPVVLGSAAILSLISPPYNVAWLHWIALVPMLWALRDDTPRANRWLAFTYGTVSTFILFRWLALTIMTFSNLHPLLAWTALFLFSVLFGLPWLALWSSVHPLRRRLGSWWILAFPALQVLLEYGQMLLFLFPYNHGVGQYRTPWVWQLASITGVAGITFLLFFVNASLSEWVYRLREEKKAPVRWLVAAGVALVATLGFGAWRHSSLEADLAQRDVLDVGVIQTDLPMTHIFSRERYLTMFPRWVSDTESIIESTDPGDVDLVVWSEGTYPGSSPARGRDARVFRELARTGGFELLMGGGTDERLEYPVTDEEWEAFREMDPELEELIGREEGDRWTRRYNSVYLFGRDGDVRGRYDKNVPLPFGEYLPLSKTFPILREWIQGPGDFPAGEGTMVLEGEDVRIATPICYEAILPYAARKFDAPDLMVNPTNDGWFASPGPQQHAMLATGRAMELGVPIIRAAYNGVSMVVEPHGDIIHEVAQMEASVEIVPVRLGTYKTVYGRFGDWFTWLCAIALAGGFAAGPWLRRRGELDEQAPTPT